MDMEFSFEMKIQDLGSRTSIQIDGSKTVLCIGYWFNFGLKKLAEESKYYISHWQYNGLGRHETIQKSNPISFSNIWKKEFLETILKTQSF